MSVKHIRKEFQRICGDYKEMLDTVHELEQAVSDNIVSQEKLDEVKQSLETIKTNYMRWSWIIHLLDLPNNKEKQKKYNRQFQNRIQTNDKLKTEEEEDREALSTFRDKINSIK